MEHRSITRRGVSLVEVLVAAVLLTVGVAGSLSALLAAAQLRSRASVRENVAQALESRLGWFAATGCALASDTIIRPDSTARVRESWRVSRDSSGARLDGRAMSGAGPHAVRRSLSVSRRCP